MTPPEAPTDRTEAAPAPASALRQRSAYLVALSGFHLGALFRLPQGTTLTLGRGDACDIVLQDDGVSRRHAEIRVVGETAELVDLGSYNGTFVDGLRTDRAHLTEGARLQLGFGTALKFTFADELEADAQRKLAEAAVRDPLTGLFNRRHFEDRLAAALGSAHRYGRPLSVLLIDVDKFKRINDQLGHAAGDELLLGLTTALRGSMRREELLARIGGDEFGVIAEANVGGATALCEKLRLAAHTVLSGGEPVTLSIGAGVLLDAPGVVRPETLLVVADRALYRAKEKGRNRAEVDVVKT